jgi:hypothetical protein
MPGKIVIITMVLQIDETIVLQRVELEEKASSLHLWAFGSLAALMGNMVLQKNFNYNRNPIFLTFQYWVVQGDILNHVQERVLLPQHRRSSDVILKVLPHLISF